MARYPEGSLAVVFQGQNVAHPEMGRDLYNRYEIVQELFRTASGVVGQDMRDVCFNYTHRWAERFQNEPEFVQPANILVELAEYAAIQDETDGAYTPDVTTGISLGLYAALVASNAANAETVIHIAHERGIIVGRNALENEGGMLMVKDLAEERIHDLLSQHPTIVEAIKWGTNQILTISGAKVAVNAAHDWALNHGATVELSSVKEAAHNLLQIGTQLPLEKVLLAAEITGPDMGIDLVSNDPLNQTAYLLTKESIIKHLLDQMVMPVQWDSVVDLILADGVDRVLEIGPGIGAKEGHLSRGIKRRSRVEALDKRTIIGRGAIEIVKSRELLAA